MRSQGIVKLLFIDNCFIFQGLRTTKTFKNIADVVIWNFKEWVTLECHFASENHFECPVTLEGKPTAKNKQKKTLWAGSRSAPLNQT